MATSWEYCSVTMQVVKRRHRDAFFSHHGNRQNIDEAAEEQFAALGKEGWEMVSAFPTDSVGNAIAIFKRSS